MRLGVEGMSSDESDHENNIEQYRILVKPWRSVAVTVWLRVFDAMYRHDRCGPVRAGNSRGKGPRLRFQSTTVDGSRPAVIRLPRNAYDERWLGHLDQYDHDILNPEEQLYDFTHAADIQQLVPPSLDCHTSIWILKSIILQSRSKFHR